MCRPSPNGQESVTPVSSMSGSVTTRVRRFTGIFIYFRYQKHTGCINKDTDISRMPLIRSREVVSAVLRAFKNKNG